MEFVMFGTPYRPDNTQPAVEALFPESKHEPRELELDYAAGFMPNGGLRGDNMGSAPFMAPPLNFTTQGYTNDFMNNLMPLDMTRSASSDAWNPLDLSEQPPPRSLGPAMGNLLDTQFASPPSQPLAAVPEALMTTDLPSDFRSSEDLEPKLFLKPEDISPASKSSLRTTERQEKERQKAEKLKEKNKRAQRKFRQRQKDRQENAERLAMDLSQQLKRVTQEKNALELRNKELEMSLQQASGHSATTIARDAEPTFKPAQGWQSYNPQGGMILVATVKKKFTHNELMSLSLRDISKLLAASVQQLKKVLHALDHNECRAEALSRIQALVDERHALISYFAVNNQQALYQIINTKMCDPPDENAAPLALEYWDKFTEDLVLTQQQIENILDARRKFIRKMDQLILERERLLASISGLKSRFEPDEVHLVPSMHLQWSNTVDALRENLDLVHRSNAYFMARVWYGDCLSSEQIARLAVRAWPHQMNIYAIVKCVMRRLGAPDHVQELMSQRFTLQDETIPSAIDQYVNAFPHSARDTNYSRRLPLESNTSSETSKGKPELYVTGFSRDSNASSFGE